MKELKFYTLEEMKEYYDEKSKTYQFWGKDGTACSVSILFNLDQPNAKILCHDLSCFDIHVNTITAWDIDACFMVANQIIAHNIDAVDIFSHKLIIINDGEINAWGNIRCDSIVWERLTNW